MLTGTPLQNDLQELQNLLGFLLPDVFQDEAAAQLADVQVRWSLHIRLGAPLAPGTCQLDVRDIEVYSNQG
jgi:hypothetical protein